MGESNAVVLTTLYSHSALKPVSRKDHEKTLTSLLLRLLRLQASEVERGYITTYHSRCDGDMTQCSHNQVKKVLP